MTRQSQRKPGEIVRASPVFSAAGREAMAELVAAARTVLLDEGEYLFRCGEVSDAVYLIVVGVLEVFLPEGHEVEEPFAHLGPGDLVGETLIVTGGRRGGDVRASGPAELVRISREAIHAAVEKDPEALDELARVVRRRLQQSQTHQALHRLLKTTDEEAVKKLTACAQWFDLPRGELLMRQGDPADCMYIVVSGRLQAFVHDAEGKESILGRIGHGETVGEMAILADDRRTAHVKALRDCSLARLDRDDFVEVAKLHPEIVVAVARSLMKRLRSGISTGTELGALRTFAIVPASPGVSVGALASELAEEMSKFGTARLVDPGSTEADLGFDIRHMTVDHSHSILLSAWLAEQEEQHDYVLFVADGSLDPWAERCVGQADMVLLVAEATADPEPKEIETGLLESVARTERAPTALLLLHVAAGTATPEATERWLAGRRLDAHYHLRQGRSDDVARVARLLTGNAVGVVLSGGGARGAAHIGVLRALRASGVSIDMIGGTSSGAGIAAQYAMGWDDEMILEANIDGFVRNNPFKRLTLPVISIIDRKKMDSVARKMYGDLQIEDLWIDFFCVSCNLTTGIAEVHRRGPLWKAIRATSSLPGIAVPVVQDGELLVDGGVVDNLPGLIMRRFMGGTVVAVDVTPGESMSVDFDYDDVPGAWRLLWNRLNPFRTPIRFPTIVDVMARTVTVSSFPARGRTLEDADLVLRPPVEQYGMMEFSAIQEIASNAYDYTMERLRGTSLFRTRARGD